MKSENPSATSSDRIPCGTLLASRPPAERKAAASAALTSVTVHGLLVAGLVWATLAVGQTVQPSDDPVVVLPIPDEPTPPAPLPPPPPPPSATPPSPVVDAPFGFKTLDPPHVVPPDIPPSTGLEIRETDYLGEGVEDGRGDGRRDGKTVTAENVEAAPDFTPFTVRPELKNRAEVARALQRLYPPLLRDAGVGGTAVVWFLIDETGKVVKTQIKAPSGHDALDRAALEVGALMRFTPALNRDQRVKVWIQLPIVFEAR